MKACVTMTHEISCPRPRRLKERKASPPDEHLVAALAAVGGRPTETTAKPDENVTKIVRRCESPPHPPRDPNNDKRMLRPTTLDNLMTVNQYCYAGRRNFDEPFRILVVGGGTGDSLVFLAVQVATLPNVEIVYLDENREAMNIVQERVHNQAKRLSLPNAETIINRQTGSLRDLAAPNLGKFDYINCGSLHHLDDPVDGLRKLGAVLNDDGALGITVHGQLGRTGVRQIQEMMRIVNRDVAETEEKIRNTNLVLRNLPSSNLHRKNGRWLSGDPAEMYDLYLREADRSFTFQEIVDGVAVAGLVLCQFASSMKPLLVPEYLQCKLPQRILTRLAAMNPNDAAVFCEHLAGIINRYEFYVTKKTGTTVDLRDWDLIPSFSCYANANSLKNRLLNPGELGESPSFRVAVYQHSIQVPIDVTPIATASYPLIDDNRTMREIVHKLTPAFPFRTPDSIRNELLKAWRHLTAFDMIQFRHVSSDVAHINRINF